MANKISAKVAKMIIMMRLIINNNNSKGERLKPFFLCMAP